MKGSGMIRSSFREDCWLSMEACGECGQSSQGGINSGLLGEALELGLGDGSQRGVDAFVSCVFVLRRRH